MLESIPEAQGIPAFWQRTIELGIQAAFVGLFWAGLHSLLQGMSPKVPPVNRQEGIGMMTMDGILVHASQGKKAFRVSAWQKPART